MAKTEQKNQFMSGLHQFSDLLTQVATQAELLTHAYNANGFAPAAANEITTDEAGQNNLTVDDITNTMKVAQNLQYFWNGSPVTQDNYRDYALSTLMNFLNN